MLTSERALKKTNSAFDSYHIKYRLLDNFFKLILVITVLIKVYFEIISLQDSDFPLLTTITVIGIQYLLFLKFKRINPSTNILLITIYLLLAWETLQTGGIYSDNLLYLLLITPACILLLDIRQTILWTSLTLVFVVYTYYLEYTNPGTYFEAANFDAFYYFNAILWLFILISGFMLTSGIILSRIFGQLKAQQKQLLKQRESLIAVNEKLSQTEKSLRKSNKALEEFAQVTAHDLKQPLRTMSSFAQLTARRIQTLNIEDKALQEYWTFIRSGSEEMSQLVEHLMQYASIKANNDIQIKEVNLRNLIERILLQINLSKEYPKTKVDIRMDEWVLEGQPARIRQLFQNLIINALKFSATEEAPQVTISSIEQQDSYHFCIEDNGIGIDPEDHDKIFQLFVKMNGPKEFKGSGIGLSTCKEVVEQIGGKIWIDSNLGKGCKMFFSVPKDKIRSLNPSDKMLHSV